MNPRFRSFFVCSAVLFISFTAYAKSFPERKFGDGGMIKGPRTLENIEANMKLIIPRLYYLFSQSRSGQHGDSGIVDLWFEVDARGAITYASTFKTTLNDEVFEDLLEATLSETRFDAWKKGREKTEIIYPLGLTPADAQSAPRSRSRRIWEEDKKKETVLPDTATDIR